MINSKLSVLKGLHIRRICAVFVAAVLMLCATACKSNPSDSSSGESSFAESVITHGDESITSEDASSESDSVSGANNDTQSQNKPTSSTENGKPGSNSNSNSNVDVKGYTFTIISTLLPTKQSSNNTLFEKLLFDRID